jgi:hypothetical protein
LLHAPLQALLALWKMEMLKEMVEKREKKLGELREDVPES